MAMGLDCREQQKNNNNKQPYIRTSLIRTPKGQSKVSVLERRTFYRGHYDDVNFKLPLTVLKRLVTKNRHTHASEFIHIQY